MSGVFATLKNAGRVVVGAVVVVEWDRWQARGCVFITYFCLSARESINFVIKRPP